jgi:NAD(P)-dependent dehydrogenase (short-subunit alcohol dehydrogenase family)
MRGVIVTGGAKRVGAAIVRLLASDGWHVVLHYQSSRTEAEALADELIGKGTAVTVLQANLADTDQRERLMADAFAACPNLYGLVNSASVFSYDTWADATEASIAHAVAVNAIAPLHLSQLFIANAGAMPGACVVNLLDNKVVALNPDYFSYTVGKVALAGLTEMLAQAVPSHIRICSVAPGITLVSGEQSHENFIAARTRNPLQQGSTPEQVAAAVSYCLNTRAFRSQTIVIDGGEHLQPHGRDVAFLDPL